MSDVSDVTVTRGQESWAYIYVLFGLSLSVDGNVIQMITPLRFPCNVLLYFVVGGITSWLFLFNGRFQNRLFGIKHKYEGAAR